MLDYERLCGYRIIDTVVPFRLYSRPVPGFLGTQKNPLTATKAVFYRALDGGDSKDWEQMKE